MEAYLRPLVSCRLYTAIIKAEKDRFWRDRKNIAKRIFMLELRISLSSVCVCVCVCV